ncbi:hypothetical protein ACLF3G_13520 [Falsiroseomonas sp. HC035]|uniref:hypothetical protein n=1 Tax=Falsiroseomonas sp. HC035 TaxID=3390999 RepID=UPI003D322987
MLILIGLLTSFAGRVRIFRYPAVSTSSPAPLPTICSDAHPQHQALAPDRDLEAATDRRLALVDEQACRVIGELLRTHPDPARAVWEQGMEMASSALPDLTDAEWRAACNRNYWPLYQTAVEALEAKAAAPSSLMPRAATRPADTLTLCAP